MGKKTKLREAQRVLAAEAISAVLAAHSKRSAYPALVTRFDELKPEYVTTIEPFLGAALRPPAKWRCRIRSRREDDRFLDLVSHLFAAFPLPAHLASVWRHDENAAHLPLRDMRDWYVIAGRGDSLYEHAAHTYLSRGETHHFLTAPPEITSTQRAFWYACARAATDDAGVAIAIAASRLAQRPITCAFWKDAARFFARQPTEVAAEMNELTEYLTAARLAQPDFSLKGRSLPALRRRMTEWRQRECAKNAGCGGEWIGCPLADSDYTLDEAPNCTTWRFRQITTGIGLYLEGERMRHCVASYHGACMRGDTSIWSLSAGPSPASSQTSVTIELFHDGAIGQCRGFSNRRPNAQETAIIERWALDNGLQHGRL